MEEEILEAKEKRIEELEKEVNVYTCLRRMLRNFKRKAFFPNDLRQAEVSCFPF